MGDLHIYEVQGMHEYLPKISYYGNRGKMQSFLDVLSASLFPKVEMEVLDKRKEHVWLKILNEARNLTLLDRKYDLIIKQMNWYVRKIIHYIADDFISDDILYWFKIERVSSYIYGDLDDKIIVSVVDDGNEFVREYKQKDFDKFKDTDNYLRRDYSDKVMAYIYNLSELHNYYLVGNKKEDLFHERLGYCPDLRCAIHGKKCSGNGYIDWK